MKKSSRFFVVFWVFGMLCAVLGAGARASDLCSECHFDPNMASIEGSTGHSIVVEQKQFEASVHGSLKCLDCHDRFSKIPHEVSVDQNLCVKCHYYGHPNGSREHDQKYREYDASVHRAFSKKQHKSQRCVLCHGETKGWMDPKGQRPEECGVAPTCATCHGSHDVVSMDSVWMQKSPLIRAQMCGQCHMSAFDDYLDSAHGQALKHHNTDSAVCSSCHGEHDILSTRDPASLVNKRRVVKTCGDCHAQKRIVETYGLPGDRVSSYMKTFHGKFYMAGDLSVSNCVSCHDHHRILKSTDPHSSVHPQNLVSTCGQTGCHQGISNKFTILKYHSLTGVGKFVAASMVTLTIGVLFCLIVFIILENVRFVARNRAYKKIVGKIKK